LAIDAGDDLSAWMRLDGNVRPDLGGKSCRPGLPRSLSSGTVQMTLRSVGAADLARSLTTADPAN
jgi:hypothetical protein